MSNLTVGLVQTELQWQAPRENRAHLSQEIESLGEETDLVVLPEMFTTGFSMNALENAEPAGGPTEDWMMGVARDRQCAITGSIAVQEGDKVFNRMLFVTPEHCYQYDKRHLFRMANEHHRYAAGDKQVVVPWRGWRISLQVCYDLRFPVWMRNRENFDLMLCVANWPQQRRYHWRQLLIARAIENQACMVGVNRLGSDANGFEYSGDSMVVAADGQLLADLQDQPTVANVVLDYADQQEFKQKFPSYMDADEFQLGPL